VEALVGRINDEQTTLAQPAIRYLHQSYPREEIAALYLTADIMLVTSLRDGMNLVAKELRLLPSPRRRRTRALRIHRCFRPRRGFLLRSTRLDPDPVPRGEFPQHVAPAPSTAYTRRFAPSGTVMSTPRRRVGRSARDALIALRIPTRA
jgi:hypothetical protein